MTIESQVSVDARALRRCTDEAALTFADDVLGDSGLWQPSLVGYRLRSDFQRDWKVEVGCWLMEADRWGFLDSLRSRLQRARNESRAPSVVGPNDSAHRILNSELAPAMVAYYLHRCGWTFVAWEPTVVVGDVDVRLCCPFGSETDFQVKAPDRPGRIANHRIVDGENDSFVLTAVDKAIKQVSDSKGPQRCVVICPQRTLSVAPNVLARHLVGRTSNENDEVVLRATQRGVFAKSPGSRVGAVIDLGLARGERATLYRCTVFLNPWVEAQGDAKASPRAQAFPGARVSELVGDRFAWSPEQPQRCFGLPSGTRYVPADLRVDG